METHPLSGDINQAIVDFIDAGRAFAMVTVFKSAGSTPRKAGTRALVSDKGELWGTIGGGLLEARARELAVQSIGSKRATLLDFKFGGDNATESIPVCGGNMRVLVDPNAARNRGAYAAAAEAAQHRKCGTLITSLQAGDPPEVTVRWLEGALAPAHDGDVLIEPVAPKAVLVIVGGGHVAQALAAQAHMVGFELAVIEDRPEFAQPALFPPGAVIHCADPAQVLNEMVLDSETYVAIVSRGHLTDSRALAACLGKPVGYLGMMGSRRKVALVRAEFIASARATAEDFDRIHAPIGLDIGAETVPEIATSIVAQLIAARRKESS